MTLLRQTLALALLAGCSHADSVSASEPTSIAVPLTAATSQIATAQVDHQDLVPYSLTASDGSGLAVTRVEARAVFEGPLAYTELHLWFHNPENRRREGTFQITLPGHASVSRFAMENDGQWMEAEVVEKQLARRAYDDFLHRKQDPALLEKADGNQFTAKVFPIAPNADKHIVISFSQELPGAQYVLPLKGLPRIGQVDVELKTRGPDGKLAAQGLHQRDWQPDRDFISQGTTVAAAVNAGTLVAAQVTVGGAAAATDVPHGVTLMVDTSASRALGYDAYVASIGKLVAGMRAKYGELSLQVVAFDQDAEMIYRGPASGFGAVQLKKLVERGAAGASDLGQALAFVGKGGEKRVVVVTDGVVTAGSDGADLVKKVAASGAERLDVVLAGGIRDEALAKQLVRATPKAGTVLDADRDDVVAALAQPIATDIKVDIGNAAWVYPRVIPSARVGERVMVFARLKAPAQAVDIQVGASRDHLGMLAGTEPLVQRALASAAIDELEGKLATTTGEDAAALKKQIAAMSLSSRVISSQTSLLVLESDDDYARYGIDRRALADILVVGDGGIERQHRNLPPAQIATPVVPVTTQTKPSASHKELALAGADTGSIGDRTADGNEDIAPAADPKAEPASGAGPNLPTPAPARLQAPAAPPPPPAPREMEAKKTDSVDAADMAEEDKAPARGAAAGPAAGDDADDDGMASRRQRAHDDGEALEQDEREQWPPKGAPVALTGELAEIEKALAQHDVTAALTKARDWHAREPGNVLALIGLGDALEAHGNKVTAARVYGSIIDLFPGRADMRRFAGERLARLDAARDLIVDTYKRAVADRPDHLTGHRLLAYALLRDGKPAEAFAAILNGVDQHFPEGRFAGGQRVLAEDAGMIGAALVAQQPSQRAHVHAELAKRGLSIATTPSTRFILYWETDGNDVDFHIQDAHHGHAYYASPHLRSGGDLYADITTGYGPECFAIQGTPKAGPYRLSINYYSQGPMGYGMGLLEVQRFDGKGKLTFEDRPYEIMNDQAYVDLGKF